MSVTQQHFSLLSKQDQYKTIWNKGVYLTMNKENSSSTWLYQINNFYAEIVYNASMSKIKEIRSFANVNALEPYLNKINIDEIKQVLEEK